MRQRAGEAVVDLQPAGLGARRQQRERRQPQRAQQVGGKIRGGEAEGKQKIEMTHGGIVGQSLAARGRAVVMVPDIVILSFFCAMS
jgi:hypothetical protein